MVGMVRGLTKRRLSIENAKVVPRSGHDVGKDDEGNVQVTTDPAPPEPEGPMISPI